MQWPRTNLASAIMLFGYLNFILECCIVELWQITAYRGIKFALSSMLDQQVH